jgi:hypothetical protein
MRTPPPDHTDKIKLRLACLEVDSDAMLELWKAIIGPAGSPMFPLDLLASAAVKRNISAASALKLLINSWNMACARSLLRTHIDTALRFSAAWLVDEPHTLATLVMEGARLDKMKDRSGERLTDARLVQTRQNEYPWLPAVYKNLSGYVHFSDAHLMDAVQSVADNGEIEILVSDRDLKFPESSWIEVIDCFRHATAMLAKLLQGYAAAKRLSSEQLAAGRAGH